MIIFLIILIFIKYIFMILIIYSYANFILIFVSVVLRIRLHCAFGERHCRQMHLTLMNFIATITFGTNKSLSIHNIRRITRRSIRRRFVRGGPGENNKE